MTSINSRIDTFVRVRPYLVEQQQLQGSSSPLVVDRPCVEVKNDQNNTLILIDPTFYSQEKEKKDQERKTFERRFNFDSVIDQHSSQEDVYLTCGAPLVQHCLDGFNSAILAYGQTGSGKTYSMLGNPESGIDDMGIIPRICQSLLTVISSVSSATSTATASSSEFKMLSVEMFTSAYQIYKEKVYDLLAADAAVPCRVREASDTGAFVEGLTQISISSFVQFNEVVAEGMKQRNVASTLMNTQSSRSHAIFSIYLKQRLQQKQHGFSSSSAAGEAGAGGGSTKAELSVVIERNSQICMVDLAGSERASLSGATGERLVEANNINRSLSALAEVIKSLSERGSSSS